MIDIHPFDGQRLQVGAPPDFDSLPAADIVRRVQEAGLVGLGGAAFPTHVKLQLPEGKRAKFVILQRLRMRAVPDL